MGRPFRLARRELFPKDIPWRDLYTSSPGVIRPGVTGGSSDYLRCPNLRPFVPDTFSSPLRGSGSECRHEVTDELFVCPNAYPISSTHIRSKEINYRSCRNFAQELRRH